MKQLTRVAFGLFVASLPACYWTPVPAILGALVFLALYGEERFVQYAERATIEAITQELETQKTALNAINFRLGMGPMPSTKIGGK